MGLTHVAVRIRGFGSNDAFTADFLVDTGALDSMAPASQLKRIGIEPVGTRTYETASGERIEFQYGLAEISFLNEVTAGQIIFGPEDTEPVLGIITLESAGFAVDLHNQTLRKLPALPLNSVA